MRTEDRGQRTEPPLVVDLFVGKGGATRAAKKRGWEVVGIDNDEAHRPDIRADVSLIRWGGRRPMLVWASPPCQEFSRWSMPWTRAKNPPPPSLALLDAAVRFIEDARPQYWIVENVRGAVPFFRPLLGAPRAICGPFFLWGNFPRPERVETSFRKEHFGSKERARRAEVPEEISEAIFRELEAEARFFKYAA